MTVPKILAFAGSLRAESFNRKLLALAANAARLAGAAVQEIDLRDLELPMFNQDLEVACGLPESAKRLKALRQEHDGFLIASPEYNSSLTSKSCNHSGWQAGDRGCAYSIRSCRKEGHF